MIKALLSLREKKPSSPRVRVKTQETATTSSIASHDGDKRTTERRERERLRGERMTHFPHKFNSQHTNTLASANARERKTNAPRTEHARGCLRLLFYLETATKKTRTAVLETNTLHAASRVVALLERSSRAR